MSVWLIIIYLYVLVCIVHACILTFSPLAREGAWLAVYETGDGEDTEEDLKTIYILTLLGGVVLWPMLHVHLFFSKSNERSEL